MVFESLRVAWRAPWPAHSPVVGATVDRVLERLSDGPFVFPYPAAFDDGSPGGPAASLTCSFWAVRALAALGRWEEAHERMEALCRLGRPLGLLAEYADPRTGQLRGNYPHAGPHLALVEAALALDPGPP